jgi:excisionase family DNA binding protein
VPRAATAPPTRTPKRPEFHPLDRMLLTVEEAAAAIGVGRTTMFELIASGAVEAVRVGRLRRIRPDALRAYVDSPNG